MVNPICRSDVCNILFRINKDQPLLIATEWTLRRLQRLVNKEEIQIFLWGFVLCCIKKPKTLQYGFLAERGKEAMVQYFRAIKGQSYKRPN